MNFFFFSSRRRHTRLQGDWSSDVCSSDLAGKLKSIAIVSASRLKSSTTLKVRKRGPSHSASLIKSADQHSFIVCVTCNGAGLRVGNRRLPLRRLFSFSAIYTR